MHPSLPTCRVPVCTLAYPWVHAAVWVSPLTHQATARPHHQSMQNHPTFSLAGAPRPHTAQPTFTSYKGLLIPGYSFKLQGVTHSRVRRNGSNFYFLGDGVPFPRSTILQASHPPRAAHFIWVCRTFCTCLPALQHPYTPTNHLLPWCTDTRRTMDHMTQSHTHTHTH